MRRGFTLLEILVVLAIVALIASVVLPNLQRLADRVSFVSERASLVAQIDELPYRCFVTGTAFELSTDTASKLMTDGHPAISVPPHWSLVVPRTIGYTVNGFCSGGIVVATAPDASAETFELHGPRCRIAG